MFPPHCPFSPPRPTLHDFAQIHFGQKAKAREWVEQARVRLFHNNVTGVLIGLNNLKCRTVESQQARARLLRYLHSNKALISYDKLRRGGYPLDSGAIEKANKFLGHVQLKRSGAWWRNDNAKNLLKLRGAKYNAKFDDAFAEHEVAYRKKPRHRGILL